MLAHDRRSRLEAGLRHHHALACLEPGEYLPAFGQACGRAGRRGGGCPVLDDVDLVKLADPPHGLGRNDQNFLLAEGNEDAAEHAAVDVGGQGPVTFTWNDRLSAWASGTISEIVAWQSSPSESSRAATC